MAAFIFNTLATIVVGIGLWMFLPRGVVLTKRLRPTTTTDFASVEWVLRNESAVPMVLLHVEHMGIHTMTADGSCEVRDLPTDTYEVWRELGIDLGFEDHDMEMVRDVSGKPWHGLTILPGDALVAHVNLNRSLIIKYRRKGWTGVLERRELQIDVGP
jgi:hypothetical protein